MYLSLRASYFFKALALCLLLLLGARKEGYGQRIYADVQRNGITQTVVPILGTVTATGIITNPTNSVTTSSLTDVTRLDATSTAGTGTAWQQLIFSGTSIPANSTIYVKINSTNALLGGGITVQAYTNSSSTSNGTTVTTSSSTFTSIDGNTYLAVSATSAFNAVRITLSSPIALGTSTANIFYAFYELPSQSCAEVIGTSIANTGVSLLGSVTDSLNAIDDNLETYSVINGGLLGLGNTISQTAYFANLSNYGDAATVTFSVPPALLSLGLFSNVTIKTYSGNNPTPISVTPLSSLLSLDLLGLLNDGERYTISFVPEQQFDRIEVSVASGIDLLSQFQIHEIQRTPAKPTVPIVYPNAAEVCYGSPATLAATATSAGSILRWYKEVNDTNLLQEGSPYTTPPITAALGDTAFYYVAAAWATDCPAESERVKIAVIANPLPTITPASADMCEEQLNAALPYTATTNNPTTYSITWDDTSFTNVSDAALTPNEILLNIPANTSAGTYIGNLKVKNNNGCESEDVPFTVTVHPKPPTPHVQINTNSQY